MHDQESIESAIRQVESGELSPAAAAQSLLSRKAAAETPPDYESLESLVDRLGTPPNDIIDSWCDQLSAIARQHEHETGQALPSVDPMQWSITPQGRLACNGRMMGSGFEGGRVTQASLDRIDQFRAIWNPVAADNDPPAAKGYEHQHQKRSVRTLVAPPHRRYLCTLTIVGCIGAGAWALYRSSQFHPESADHTVPPMTFSPNAIPEASPTDSAVMRTEEAIGEFPTAVPTGSFAVLDTIQKQTPETLESRSGGQLSTIEEKIENSDSLSLDSLMPADAIFVPSPVTASASDDPLSGGDMTPAADAAGAAGEIDSTNGKRADRKSVDDRLRETDSEDDSPPETPQATRASSVMAIQLPSIGDGGATRLADRPVDAVRLDFPYDVPLQIQGEVSPWQICDTRKNIAVAMVSSSSDGTELAWGEDASRSASAPALAHGRLTFGNGDTVFLRSQIEAEPWPIRFDRPDVMPSWDLRHPIPPGVTRFSIDFDLPDEIEAGWIEAMESESLRRSDGLAVLTPKNGKSVSLAIRFDIQCGRKLSCRVRYAGRLDPSMPWHVLSAPLLEQYASQLTQQAIAVSNEVQRLDAVYEVSRSSDRRILRIKQKRNEALAESIRGTSESVGQLQTLMAMLEADGALKVRVWVDWPDTTQDLLTTEPEAGEANSEASR